MSAFIVEDKTINRVVSFLATDRDGEWIRGQIKDKLGINISWETGQRTLGELMFSLNCDAVNQRYGENEAASFRPLNYQYRMDISNRIQAYKSLQCWHYQCSEGDIPEQSELYKVMERVQGQMAEMIVNRLDAYDKAVWA